jgi:hypothetical protein
MKLAVLSCFYSFAGYQRPIANLHRFLRQMQKEGVPVFGVEAHLPGRPAHTRPYTGWTRIEVDKHRQVLWHKEALLNLAEKRVPGEFDAVAWVDADVWFSNPNWVRDTEAALETFDVVQMFSEAVWTAENGAAELRRPSVAKFPLNPSWKSHPGFAWAMRRDRWRQMGGLYPYALSGGGDSVMTLAFQNNPLWPLLLNHLGSNHNPYQEWRSRVGRMRVGEVIGQCWHEWHGSREDRDYVGRAKRTANIEIGRDIVLAPNGLPMWTPQADPRLVKDIADHFIRRNEDGNQ